MNNKTFGDLHFDPRSDHKMAYIWLNIAFRA